MINAETTIIKKLPIDKLNEFTDRVVYNTADITLQRTEPHIPVRSKHMYDDIFARGVQGHNKVYTLGVNETPYAKYVWKMPQSTDWTNKRSYAKWFITEFRNEQEKIMNMAVNRAMKVIK
jgi:hypothetical protein